MPPCAGISRGSRLPSGARLATSGPRAPGGAGRALAPVSPPPACCSRDVTQRRLGGADGGRRGQQRRQGDQDHVSRSEGDHFKYLRPEGCKSAAAGLGGISFAAFQEL